MSDSATLMENARLILLVKENTYDLKVSETFLRTYRSIGSLVPENELYEIHTP